MDDIELELTEREYFELESFDAEIKYKELEIELIKAKQDISRKSITIYGYIVDNIKKESQEKEKLAINKQTAIANLKLAKDKINKKIEDRLGLDDKTNWGYNPDTLEVIIE